MPRYLVLVIQAPVQVVKEKAKEKQNDKGKEGILKRLFSRSRNPAESSSSAEVGHKSLEEADSDDESKLERCLDTDEQAAILKSKAGHSDSFRSICNQWGLREAEHLVGHGYIAKSSASSHALVEFRSLPDADLEQ